MEQHEDKFLTPIKFTVKSNIVNLKDTKSYNVLNDDKADIVEEIANFFRENDLPTEDCKIIGSFIFGRTWNDIDIAFRYEKDMMKFLMIMSQLEEQLHEKFHVIKYLGEEGFINIQDRFSFWTKYRFVLRLDGKLEIYNIEAFKVDDWILNSNYDIKDLIYEHGWYPINYCDVISNNFEFFIGVDPKKKED